MKTRLSLALLFAAVALSGLSHAEIYKYVDAEGRVTYTNVPMKGAKKLDGEGMAMGTGKRSAGGTASPAPSAGTASPGGFPKVDATTQRGRDDIRRRVLNEELATEERLLADAQRAYNNGAPPANAGEAANSPQYLERVAKLRQTLNLHEKNVAALRQEISNLK